MVIYVFVLAYSWVGIDLSCWFKCTECLCFSSRLNVILYGFDFFIDECFRKNL